MGYMFVLGGKGGWAMGHSTSGEVFGPVFNSEIEIKHFIGFWLTLYEKDEWSDCYDEWYDKYYTNTGDFIGKEGEYEDFTC